MREKVGREYVHQSGRFFVLISQRIGKAQGLKFLILQRESLNLARRKALGLEKPRGRRMADETAFSGAHESSFIMNIGS
jgi:hypothetical protein